MERDEVVERVRAEASRVLDRPASELVEHARFIEDLGADSLDLIEILMPIEEHFDIDAGQAGLDHVRTVGDFIAHVLAARPSAATS